MSDAQKQTQGQGGEAQAKEGASILEQAIAATKQTDRSRTEELLRALTVPGTEKEASIDCLGMALRRATSGVPTGSLIFIIADLNRDPMELEPILGALIQRNTLALIPVDDPADWEIPAMGLTTFTGTDGTLIEIDTDDPQARQEYLEGWREKRTMLRAMAYRLNIPMMPIRTDEEIHLSLIYHLEQRSRVRAV